MSQKLHNIGPMKSRKQPIGVDFLGGIFLLISGLTTFACSDSLNKTCAVLGYQRVYATRQTLKRHSRKKQKQLLCNKIQAWFDLAKGRPQLMWFSFKFQKSSLLLSFLSGLLPLADGSLQLQ